MIYGEEDFDVALKQMIKDYKVSGDGKPEKNSSYRHAYYDELCEHANEMSWHIYGEKPTELLNRVRPNEPPEVTEYRLNNYEPKTKSSADKCINIVSKIFNPNLYSIRWSDENSDSKVLKDYTLENYPVCNSLVNYVKDVLLRKMLADPNGLVAAKLSDIPDKTNELTNPILVIYGSENIWNYDEDHYLIFIDTTQEKSKNGNTITWFYFEYYDSFDWRKFKAYCTSTGKLIIEELESYVHGFNEIPAWTLKGLPEAKNNGDVIYKSFFSSAVPYWNDAITHESDVKASFILHIYPQKYELSEPCNYKWDGSVCRGGTIKLADGTSMQCPKCDGSGYRNMAGPFGVYKIAKEKLQEGDSPVGIDPVGYITTPIDATKLLEERAENQRRLGMWAINMDVEDEVGENQSGVAKAIDRSAQYDTLYNIATVVFDHIENAYYFFNKYMFGVSNPARDIEKNLPQVNKPTQFDIASTTELVNNYKAAKESGLDPNYLQIKQIEIGTRDLTTNPDLKRFTNLILDLDPLPGLDQITISANVAKGFNRNVDAVVHFNIKRFIERAIQEDRGFMEKSKAEQITILEQYGEEMVKENKPKVDQTLMQQYGKQKEKEAA